MINFGALQGGGFENALSTGLQLGQLARKRQDEREFKNALAAYDPSKPETLQPIMAVRPDVGMQLRADMQRQQQAQNDARRADLPLLTRLVEGSTDETTYQRNLQVAQQYGVDVSTLPAQFDPVWREQTLGSLKMLSDPQTQAALSTIGKEVADMGFRPGTPEFNAEVSRRWEQSQVKTIPYQAGGNVITYNPATNQATPLVMGAGQQVPQQPMQPPAQQPAQVPVVPRDMFEGDVLTLGLPRAIQFAVSKGMAVPITGDEEYNLLPSGAAFVGPDGQMRRKP